MNDNTNKNGSDHAEGQSRLNERLGDALKATGFVLCEFVPDNDPCECCGIPHLQHYWRRTDTFSQDGEYYCEWCIRDEYAKNQEAPNEKLTSLPLTESEK